MDISMPPSTRPLPLHLASGCVCSLICPPHIQMYLIFSHGAASPSPTSPSRLSCSVVHLAKLILPGLAQEPPISFLNCIPPQDN